MNKFIKKYREQFARKCSREKTLQDVFNRLLLSSAPHISTLRKLPKRNSQSLSPEVINLLLPPEVNTVNSDDFESDNSSVDECDSSEDSE